MHAVAPGTFARRAQLRLLAAEDDATNQVVTTRLLDRLGCSARIVTTGHEAIAALQEAAYDLVLMDCQMPEMDGWEATQRIRAGEAGPQNAQVTIVALTANGMAGDRQRCIAEGMDDYLSKPLRLHELSEMLDRWADRLITPRLKSSEAKSSPQLDEPGQDPPGEHPDLTAPIPAEVQIHNRGKFLQITGDDAELAGRVTAAILADIPKLLSGVSSAVHGRSYKRVSAFARRMRGAAMSVGADRLQQASAQMEASAGIQNPSRIREVLSRVEAEWHALARLLAG